MAIASVVGASAKIRDTFAGCLLNDMNNKLSWLREQSGPTGTLGRNWSTSGMAVWVAILLAAYLVLYFL